MGDIEKTPESPYLMPESPYLADIFVQAPPGKEPPFPPIDSRAAERGARLIEAYKAAMAEREAFKDVD
jgi:hypothetical protein